MPDDFGSTSPGSTATLVARGRYAIFADGAECGHERWSIERFRDPRGARGSIARGEQETRAPHPFPSTVVWRAEATDEGRVVALDVTWTVGGNAVNAAHRADGERWSVTIDVGGHARAQSGDYPQRCEVLLGSHAVHALAFSRYALAPGAEHAFPALSVGPPWMAVEPVRHTLRCTDRREQGTPFGVRTLRRVEVRDPDRAAESFWWCWLDEHDIVVDSFESDDESRPWMRLVEYERAGSAR